MRGEGEEIEAPLHLGQHLAIAIVGRSHGGGIGDVLGTVRAERRIKCLFRRVVFHLADLCKMRLVEVLQRGGGIRRTVALTGLSRLFKMHLRHGNSGLVQHRDVSTRHAALGIHRPLRGHEKTKILAPTGGVLVTIRHLVIARAGHKTACGHHNRQEGAQHPSPETFFLSH